MGEGLFFGCRPSPSPNPDRPPKKVTGQMRRGPSSLFGFLLLLASACALLFEPNPVVLVSLCALTYPHP